MLRNNLYQKLRRRWAPLALSALLCALALLAFPGIVARADGSDPLTVSIIGSFETEPCRDMLASINDLRANDAWYWNETDTAKIQLQNLTPLVYDYELERVAMQRAAELAVYYSHTRANGETCFTAYPDELRWGCGENIAYGQRSGDEVFVAWAEADELYAGQGHRRNMLNENFRSVGIGCFNCNGILFWVQEFSSVITDAASNPLATPVDIQTLRNNISDVSLDRGRIDLMPGNSLDLQNLAPRITDAYSPQIQVPCAVENSAFQVADPSVARISNGKLTALSLGETTLTVSFSGLSVSVPVYVREDSAYPLTLETPLKATIPAGETVLFSFVPSASGCYVFSSSGGFDTFGYLYDEGMTQLDSDDDGGSNYNFALSCQLTAGTKYYFGAKLYNSAATGEVTVTLTSVNGGSSQGFNYLVLNDGTASITGCTNTGDVVIPSTLDGYTVSNLASQLFFGKNNIRSVTIPATVTYFGSEKTDNDWDYVFSYCFDLENIFVDSANPTFSSLDGVLYSKDGNTLINYPTSHGGAVYHVKADFLCCTAFAGCRNLKFLFLDNADTSWFTDTFYNTRALTVVYLGGGDTEDKVKTETLAGRVYENEEDPYWCAFLNDKEIQYAPANLDAIEAEAFQSAGIKYLVLPDGCRRIAGGAFTGSALVYLRVGPDTVIEDGAVDASVVVERG